jgi:hypothetical protein
MMCYGNHGHWQSDRLQLNHDHDCKDRVEVSQKRRDNGRESRYRYTIAAETILAHADS